LFFFIMPVMRFSAVQTKLCVRGNFRSRGESKEGPPRQNNIIRSIAAASHANSTDGVVFPFPIKAQGFDWSLFLWPFQIGEIIKRGATR